MFISEGAFIIIYTVLASVTTYLSPWVMLNLFCPALGPQCRVDDT